MAVVAALGVASCSSGGGATGGFRAHRWDPGWGMDAIVGGVVEVDLDGGCVWLSDSTGARHPVIWPLGTTMRSDPVRITLADGQSVRTGDLVQGGGGYLDAGAATRLGLNPFPIACIHVGQAVVFNADSSITVTPGVGLNPPETLLGRFSLPQPIGLELIAVNAGARSVAMIDFVGGTVHLYQPHQYQAPDGAIDGASGGGGWIHLWSSGTIYSYPGRIDSEPVVYRPDPLRHSPGVASTLQVLPAPDGIRTWLVQSGDGDQPTLVELVEMGGVQVTPLATAEVDGAWRPAGATIYGVVLVGGGADMPLTRLVDTSGTIRAAVQGTALSVGWNGAAILRPDGDLVVTDGFLDNPVPVERPGEGQWVSVGGPMAPGASPPARTGTDEFVVMRADEPGQGPLRGGEVVVVDAVGVATPIFRISPGPHLASWSRGEDWVIVVEGSSVTLVPRGEGSEVPLGDVVPDAHWVLSAG